jgi:hypothetical protein
MNSTDEQVERLSFPPALQVAARVISYIFHPLFIPVYISWFLIYQNPVFPAFSSSDKAVLLLRFVVMYTVFPLVTVLLAKALGFVDSIYLKTRKDRIIPYVGCGLYYFWMWYVLRNQPEFPEEFVMLSLAIFLSASAGLVLNSFIKVSMHALSMGVMVVFILLMAFRTTASYGPFISIALLIAGLVCTARFIHSDHTQEEVYFGLGIGALSQIIAYFVA